MDLDKLQNLVEEGRTLVNGVQVKIFSVQCATKGTPGFNGCLFRSGAFHVLKGISQNIFLQLPFFLVLISK